METIFNPKDYEYTVHDKDGIKAVKVLSDGTKQEVPVSKEDWGKAHPKHRDILERGCICS